MPEDKVSIPIEVKYDKDTPKKHRFTGETEDETISVAVYVKKTRASVPGEIVLTLISK